MMTKRGFIYGTITGFLLGLIFYLIEKGMDIKLFTLLLNVDFIPILGTISFPVYVEFSFHLIVSWAIAITFVWVVHFLKVTAFFALQLTAFLLTFPAFLLYFPLTAWALKEVPAPTDFTAFFYWVIGHFLYSISLGYLEYRHIHGKNSDG